MNLSSIRSQAKIYLMGTSTDTASIAWSDAELNRYANEGTLYIQQISEFYQDSDNKVVTSGTSTYSAPSLEHQFIRLAFDRQLVPQTNEYEPTEILALHGAEPCQVCRSISIGLR